MINTLRNVIGLRDPVLLQSWQSWLPFTPQCRTMERYATLYMHLDNLKIAPEQNVTTYIRGSRAIEIVVMTFSRILQHPGKGNCESSSGVKTDLSRTIFFRSIG